MRDTASICPKCATLNLLFAETCGKCGARIAGLAASERRIYARFLFAAILAGPVQLEPGKTYRVGRDRANEVYLPSVHVSRLHAEVKPRAGRWIVQDQKSLNGTYVNGKKVSDHVLEDGDKITVGELDIAYVEATREQAKAIKAKGEGIDVDETVRAVFHCEELEGDVDTISPAEVIHLLHNNRKTGCLEMTESGTARVWRLFFLKGALVHAESAGESGEAAVHEALRVTNGRFVFRSLRATKITIVRPVMSILLDAGGPTVPA